MKNKDNKLVERFPSLSFAILEEIDQADCDPLWLSEIRDLLQEMISICEESIKECSSSESH